MNRKHWSTPLTFFGAAGVQVRASALLARRHLSKTYRVQQIVFAGGTFGTSEDHRRIYTELTHYVRALVGKTSVEWAAASLASSIRPIGTVVTKKSDKVETVDCPGCTTEEQAEALANNWRSRHPGISRAWREADLGKVKARVADRERRTPSNTLGRVMREMRDREQFGLGKYGTTVDRTDLSVKQWLQHAKEEAMDSVLYLDRLIQEEEVREADPARPSTRPKWAQPCPMAPYTGLHACHHNTAVNLTGIWTEAFGPPVTDVRTPLGFEPRKVAPSSSDFFDTRLSA